MVGKRAEVLKVAIRYLWFGLPFSALTCERYIFYINWMLFYKMEMQFLKFSSVLVLVLAFKITCILQKVLWENFHNVNGL